MQFTHLYFSGILFSEVVVLDTQLQRSIIIENYTMKVLMSGVAGLN